MKNKKLTFTFEEAKKKLEFYCSYQERCHQEVETKLNNMNMIPQAKELIFLHLLENNYLNEERFSKSFARGKFRIKKWGKHRITKELKLRNISEYNIKSALNEIDSEDYLETLRQIALKKKESVKEKNKYKKSQKIVNFLLYRGFESNLVYEIVKEVMLGEK